MPNAILDPAGGGGPAAGQEQARGVVLCGAPGYRYATTPHPVAVLTPDQVRERALAVLPDVVALLISDR